nr:glycoside hydrolase family 3 C-terminal domain-containing protein [Bacteroides intestinalis]
MKNDCYLMTLVPSKLNSIAVIGPNADQVQFGDYTWSRDNKDGVTPLAGIRSLLAGTGVQVRYAKGCSIMSLDTTNIAAAVAAARASDVAVLFCGSASASLARNYREVNCGEGFDLTDLSLSGAQEKLIRDVHATGKPLILVMVTGKPFSIPWEKKHVPTILVQWYAGEQGGNAVADILFGKTVPSGRLPVSFPQSAGHLPAHYNYLPTDHGYYRQPGSYEVPGRDYVFSSPEPLWAFGHGLSYTVFDYEDMKIEQREDSIMLSVCIRNIGERAGQVVPQLYVRDLYSSVVTPVKQLKAFAKVFLKPKETIEVSLNVAIQDLAFTNNQGKMVLESGDFELQVGDSSDKIFLRDTVQIGFQDTTYQVKETVLDTMNSCGEAVITVKGIVRDTQATPIQGVNIFSTLQKKILVVTDKDGKYEIKVQSNDILIFHKKNYLEEKIFVNGKPSIQITIRNGI